MDFAIKFKTPVIQNKSENTRHLVIFKPKPNNLQNLTQI